MTEAVVSVPGRHRFPAVLIPVIGTVEEALVWNAPRMFGEGEYVVHQDRQEHDAQLVLDDDWELSVDPSVETTHFRVQRWTPAGLLADVVVVRAVLV